MQLRQPAFLGLAAIVLAAVLVAAPSTSAAPAPPSGLTGMALDGRVELAWQPRSGASAYAVYRGTSQSSITTRVTPPTGVPGTSFADTTVVQGTVYYYAVRSIDSGGESGNSLVVQARPRPASCSTGNYVVVENCRPGDSSWRVTNPGGIAGFATATSINKGESVNVKVDSAGPFRIEIYRTGYYGGALGRLFSTSLGFPASIQPGCTENATTGLVDCSNWATSATLTTTQAWPSGAYLLRLVRTDNGSDTQVLLAIRDDARPADLLYGVGFTTYAAYNNYGGRSLYNWNSWGPSTVSGAARAVSVSFDRPFVQANFQSHDWYTWTDLPFVSWLEQFGYSVTYTSNTDLERNGQRLRDHQVYVMAGHDEYWSAGMRTAVEQARDAGTSILSPSANAVYWKVRFENGPGGGQDRVMTCYKSTQSGGPDPSGIHTGTWRDPAGANNPENALLGSMYIGDNDYGYSPLVVSAAQGGDSMWRYTPAATQSPGSSLSIGMNLVGWEWDARVSNGREPPGVKVLASRTMSGLILQDAGRTYAEGSATVHAVKYVAPSGAVVFNAGTNNWSLGLGEGDGGLYEPNTTIQQATTNLLSDMGVQPETPPAGIQLDANNPPTVISRSPADGAVGVSPGTTVRATFSRTMDASTITPASFRLTPQGGAAVAATVTYDASTRTATLTPSAPLALSRLHTATLATTIKASDGNPLASQVSWSFTTAASPPPAPTVTSRVPASNATDVSAATSVQATFSRDMDSSTISTGSFTLTRQGGAQVAATVGFDAPTRTAALTPSALLAYGATYTARLTTAVTASDGTALASDVTWSFTTEAAPPPPTVTDRSPAPGSDGVALTATARATFSRAMDASTITGSSFTLTPQGGSPVAATVSYDAQTNQATLVPSGQLSMSTTYTANLASTIRAADGTALAAPVAWTFTTSSNVCPCSLFSPVVQPASQNNPTQDGRPGSGPWSYELGVKIQVDQAMQVDAIRFWKGSLETGTHIGRVWQDGVQVAQVTFQNETASGWQEQALPSPVTLEANTPYIVSVGLNAYYSLTAGGLATQVVSGPLRSVADGQNGVYGASAGTFPDQSYNSSNYFVDLVATLAPLGAPPTVTQTTPAGGATGIGTGSNVTATFSRGMSSTTINGSTFTLTPQGGSPVPATVTYNGGTRTATLRPSSPLSTATSYTANLSTAITAADGVAMAGPVSWSFTTSSTVCPCSLFPPTLQPVSQNNPTQDGRSGPAPWSYEMGVKIQADRAMQIDAIRFWKGSLETGTHIGRVWTQNGSQLAQVTFQNETAAGWQEQALQSPVALEANTVYVVSVGLNAYYSTTQGGLATEIVSGPLRSVADGQNGVHSSAAGEFPTQSWLSSNYFVDLVANVSPQGAPPTVSQTTPANGESGVGTGSDVSATFSRAMSSSTINASSFTLSAQGGAAVPATVSYDAATRRATLRPSSPLSTGSTYTANLAGTITAADGVALASAVSWTFTTSSNVCPCSLFPPNLQPVSQNNPTQDGRPGPGPWSYEMGVKIQVDQLMQVNTIRFWKGSLETGTHVGRIWTAGGAQLAQVTFQNESASGWQEQALANPLTLAPDTVYVVSVGFNAAYSNTPQGLATQIVSGPLRSVADGRNGVYGPSAGTFPGESSNSANYFVDLSVTVATSGSPPGVTQTTPAAGAGDVGVTTAVRATFTRPMDASTITSSSFTLAPQGGSALAAAVSYDPGSNTAVLTPASELMVDTTYVATLQTTIEAADGTPLANPVSWSFTTSGSLSLTSTSPIDAAVGIGRDPAVTATFSKAMDEATISASSFTLTPAGGSAIPARVSYDAATKTATLYPLVRLPRGNVHTVRIDTTVRAADGTTFPSDRSWSFTTRPGCPCRLFSQWSEPLLKGVDTRDGRPEPGPWTYELGVKIDVDEPLDLTGIRFWKSAPETGTHIGRVWTSSGSQLAEVTFTNETASGWQEQSLSTPLPLAPGTYVVSVNFNVAYSVTEAGLATRADDGPLASVADGQNGVSGPAAGEFPDASFNSSNYFVDAQVGPEEPVATDTTPPAPVSNFTATLQTSSVALTWNNPSDSDLAFVHVVRKAGSAPGGPTDGTVLCGCNGQSSTDSAPPAGTTYHYAAYAYDTSGNASAPSTAQVTGVPDTTPPGPVSSFSASVGASDVTLTWQNPSASDLAHVRVVRKAGSPPADATDGVLVCDCTGSSATDARPADGATYHYVAYAHDRSGNASTVSRAQANAPAAENVYTSYTTDTACATCSATVAGTELSAAIAAAANSLDTAYGTRDFGGAAGLPGRIYVRTNLRLPSQQVLAGVLWVFSLRDTANRVIFEISLTASRVIRLTSPAGGLRATAITQSTGISLPNNGSTIRRVEVSALANNSVEVRVDGVTRVSIANLTGATTSNPRYLRAGIERYDGNGSSAVRIFHGRVTLGQADWLG